MRHINAFVKYDFFSYLSARAPPKTHATKPIKDYPIALYTAYSDLNNGKFLPKNIGKNASITIPPKFLSDVAINTFLAHGRVNTYPKFCKILFFYLFSYY